MPGEEKGRDEATVESESSESSEVRREDETEGLNEALDSTVADRGTSRGDEGTLVESRVLSTGDLGCSTWGADGRRTDEGRGSP